MEDQRKTEAQLLNELTAMRQHLAEFEKSEIHHKQVEEALRESEEIFRLFMEHSPIYVFFKDEHIRSMQLSKNYEKMLGKPIHELIGKTMYDLFPSDLAESMVKDDLRILREGKPIEVIEELNGRFYATTKFPIIREDKPARLAGFTIDITGEQLAEKALRESEARFRGYFELPLIGFALTSPEKEWLDVNDRMCSMLGYSREELLHKTWAELTHPEDLAANVTQFNRLLAGHIENYSMEKRFIRKNGEVVWVSIAVGSMRDNNGMVKHVLALGMNITDRKKIEEALQRSEKEAKQLARENATIADIGRIISSTLNIEDVYERFAEKVQEIIPFDRISVNVLNLEKTSLTVAYINGISVPGRVCGDRIHLFGSLTEEVMRTRKSQIIQGEKNRLVSRYPALLLYLNAGLCSMMSVPLISKDNVIGVLRLRSKKENAYADRDLRLAERVADQIAGAIANAQLFNELKQAEDALLTSEEEAQRLAQENAIMAEIGRIINSSLDIDEVYERFSEEVRMLVPSDRISINIVNQDQCTITMTYNTGTDVADRRRGDIIPLADTVAEKTIRTRSSILMQGEDMRSLRNRFPGSSPILRDQFPSMMMVPLISKDLVIAVLSLRSTRPQAFTERDLRLAERVGNQIAGAIANTQLYTDLKKAEISLKKSEEEAQNLAQENAIVAEIGRIISSSLNIDEVYERFGEKVRELIPFDRIAINTFNPDTQTITYLYVMGTDIPARQTGTISSLVAGSATEECIRRGSGLLIQSEETEELSNRFPRFMPYLEAGLRSMMLIPLISQDQVIGVLYLRSKKLNAYTEHDLKLAEKVGHQIAGAIAGAQLYTERKKAVEALRKSEEEAKRLAQENAIMAEIGRVISSSLNIDEVYERFTKEVAKLVSFDRIVINLVNAKDNTTAIAYAHGVGLPDHPVGSSVPLAGTATEECCRTRSSMLIQPEDIHECLVRFPGFLSNFQAGLRSMMFLPLISKDQFIGVLSLRSLKPKAYRDQDVKIAERVANQIAGAIANAQLFAEHQRTETEKASLEEQFRQSQKLEAIGRLAGGIAHDFNNVLTIIKGYSQLSLRGLNEKDPLTGNLREIFTAANRAADLTRQLLAFSRKQILEHRVLDLNQMIQGMEKMLRRLIEEDVELLIHLQEDLGRIKVDLGQIEQVIFNLAINARDAMPSGGSLILETDNVYLDKEYARNHVSVKPGHYVRLSISDTGHGMDAEVRTRAFDPFFTTKEMGTGLGLSTVYGIVKQSEGHIWLYSEVGKGTTFKMYFPRVDEPADVLEENRYIEMVPLGNETVLVLEDEDEVRSLVVQILQKQGYKVLEASNSGEAFLICEEHQETIHLILTDVVMPRMSGPEFINRMRKIRHDFSVLYMSGYTDEAVLFHGVRQGTMDFIQKPFTYEMLARKVRGVLDKLGEKDLRS